MQDKQEIIAPPEEEQKKQAFSSTSAAQIIILVNGVILTLVVFFFLSIFTEEIIRDEQSYVANQTIQSFLYTAERMGTTIDKTASISSLGASLPDVQKELIYLPQISKDYRGVFVAINNDNSWNYELVYDNSETDFSRIYQLLQGNNILVNKVLQHIKDHNIDANKVFSYTTFLKSNGQNLYITFLVRSAERAGRQIYAFGLLSMHHSFDMAFNNTSEYLDTVSLQNMSMPEARWVFDVDNADENIPEKNSTTQNFLVNVWQTPMKVSISFNDEHKLFFLKHIPSFFGLVGFF